MGKARHKFSISSRFQVPVTCTFKRLHKLKALRSPVGTCGHVLCMSGMMADHNVFNFKAHTTKIVMEILRN